MAGGTVYSAQSASAKIEDGPCTLEGIFVSTSSSLTLKVWDNNAASGNVIIGTTAAITAPCWLAMPAVCKTALYVQAVAGSGTWTVHYKR